MAAGESAGCDLQENAAIAPIFQQWIEPLKDLNVSTITLRNTGGTGPTKLDGVGIPGFQFIQDPLDYGSRSHHSNMDTYERLSPRTWHRPLWWKAHLRVQHGHARNQMLPRNHYPELDEKLKAPLRNLMPGAEPAEKGEPGHTRTTPQQ